MRRLLLSLSACCLAATCITAVAQTPRDVFWSASDLVSVSANPAGAKRAARPAVHRKPSAPQAGASAHIEPQLVAQNGFGEAPHLVRTSLQNQQIGLRYTLLLSTAGSAYREVLPETVFHQGDHVRLSLMSNEPGYLYVITKGSSGKWSPIFPGADAEADTNRIEAGQVYQIPNAPKAFEFDARPGTETLFVVLSRERIADLDSAIGRLKSPAPASEPAPVTNGAILEAENHIPDDLVQRLASRDLTLVTEQKVDGKSTANAQGEKAVYVVAKQDASATHEVVATIRLNHQ